MAEAGRSRREVTRAYGPGKNRRWGILLLLWGLATRATAVDSFTEDFAGGGDDFDLQNVSLLLTPDGSSNVYSACTNAAAVFPTPTAGHTVLPLNDDAFTNIVLAGGTSVVVHGVAYTNLFIGSNGYITFSGGDVARDPVTADHFNQPRVSGLMNDLNPLIGGAVFFGQESDRAVVTFDEIRKFNTAEENSFQIELFFDGRIQITWLAVQTTNGIAGISGGGLAGDGIQSGTESGISNVTVQLLHPTLTNVLDLTITGANGIYAFNNLATGAYRVAVIAPAGFDFTQQDQGFNDDLDSDVHPMTGITPPIDLLAGQQRDDVDAGLIPPSVSFVISTQTVAEAASGFTADIVLSHVATITDNDPPPTLNIMPVVVSEGSFTAMFEVTLDAASGRDITVDFSAVAGTALAGSDFDATNGVLTITEGMTNVQIVVTLIPDPFDEIDEMFSLVLSNLNHAVFGVRGSSATATILDDDLPPILTVNDVTVPEDAGIAGFAFALSEASGRDITVDFATADGSAITGRPTAR